LCLRCYDQHRYWRRSGRPAPYPKHERWSLASPLGCRNCGSNKLRHQARGLCTRCYSRFLTVAKREGRRLPDVLDSLGHTRTVSNALFDLPGGIAMAVGQGAR
jgi:hypothetical protein